MIGVPALGPGIATFHAMFSVLENVTGRPDSVEDPLWFGPRQLAQSAALTAAAKVMPRKTMVRIVVLVIV